MRWIKLYGAVNAAGAATLTSEIPVRGELYAVEWIDGTLVDGVDAVLSVVRDDNAADYTLLTLTNANSDAVYYPRKAAHDDAGAVVTFDGTNEIYTKPIINGYLKLAITNGSAGAGGEVGGCIVYYEAD